MNTSLSRSSTGHIFCTYHSGFCSSCTVLTSGSGWLFLESSIAVKEYSVSQLWGKTKFVHTVGGGLIRITDNSVNKGLLILGALPHVSGIDQVFHFEVIQSLKDATVFQKKKRSNRNHAVQKLRAPRPRLKFSYRVVWSNGLLECGSTPHRSELLWHKPLGSMLFFILMLKA